MPRVLAPPGREFCTLFLDPQPPAPLCRLHAFVYPLPHHTARVAASEVEPVSDPASYQWDAGRVRALRRHLGDSQQELADRLGTRQQTISEWETASSRPRRMSRRLLTLVADAAGFYDATTEADSPAAPAHDGDTTEAEPTESPAP